MDSFKSLPLVPEAAEEFLGGCGGRGCVKYDCHFLFPAMFTRGISPDPAPRAYGPATRNSPAVVCSLVMGPLFFFLSLSLSFGQIDIWELRATGGLGADIYRHFQLAVDNPSLGSMRVCTPYYVWKKKRMYVRRSLCSNFLQRGGAEWDEGRVLFLAWPIKLHLPHPRFPRGTSALFFPP